ncbi:MAG: hypothetical protein ABI972_28290 [Acidobacteriota bacterium]
MERPFRLCDIRGVYPDEVNEEIITRAGRGIAGRCAPGEEVLVARDHRASSPSLHQALIEGLVAGGASVLDAGPVPTPLLYFGKRHLRVRYAATVTASHNPPSQNGMKFLPPDQSEIAAEALLLARQIIPVSHTRGSVRRVELFEPYLDWMLNRWQAELTLSGSPSFVLDPGGGLWSELAARVFAKLGLSAWAIHDEPSSSFEARSPDCTLPHVLDPLGEEVRLRGAAAGFAWDGDGDRLAICDDTGKSLSTDLMALLFVPKLLDRMQPESVLLDVKMSERVSEAVRTNGGSPIVSSSAHCLLERAMRLNQCLFGCEYSGHYLFRELDFADDGVFAALAFCSLVLRSGESLSELANALPPLFITPDIRIPCGPSDFTRTIDRLSVEFQGSRFDRLDGLRIVTPDGWILARQSVSEDKITWRMEGNSQAALEAILRRVARAIPEARAYLALG